MNEDTTSNKMMADIDNLVRSYIDTAKQQGKIPTRNEIIDRVTNKLEELLKLGSEKKEITWIVSGAAIGIAIVLHAEDMLDAEHVEDEQTCVTIE
jgi:hypothetical protein